MKLHKSTYENAPEGTFPAIVTVVSDLGTQYSEWAGKTRQQQKIGIEFELIGEQTTDGKPFAVASVYTASLHPQGRLYPVIKAAMGGVPDVFEMKDLLGKCLLVTIEHREYNDKIYSNVTTVSSLPKGTKAGKTDTPMRFFDLENPDKGIYDQLPALFRKKLENRVTD